VQAGNVLRVRTISTTHFTATLAQYAAIVLNLAVGDIAGAGAGGQAGYGLAAGKHMRSKFRELRILSKQNLAWAVELYASATGIEGSDIDAEKFLGRWEFQTGDGRKDTADTFWKYWIAGLDMAYQDMDLTGKLHIRLINLSATGKSADAAGAIVLEFGLEPTQGI
jgi:hypothetical protein